MRKATLLLALCLVLCACVPGGADRGDNDAPPPQRLAAAKRALDSATTIGFTIATDDPPAGTTGLVAASGTGNHAPAFKGEVQVSTSGGTGLNAPVVAIDGQVYAQFPFVGWEGIDTREYGAPDPAALMDTDSGVSSLFTATRNPRIGDRWRHGKDVLTEVSGALPGPAVRALFPASGTRSFRVTYSLTDDDEPRRISITGPFYDGEPDVTYVMTLDLAAEAVEVTPPI